MVAGRASLSEKDDSGTGVIYLEYEGHPQVTVLQLLWWIRRIIVERVSRQLLGTHPYCCCSAWAENVPQKHRYLWATLREAGMERRGKKTYTFNAGDIVPCVCVCILNLQVCVIKESKIIEKIFCVSSKEQQGGLWFCVRILKHVGNVQQWKIS